MRQRRRDTAPRHPQRVPSLGPLQRWMPLLRASVVAITTRPIPSAVQNRRSPIIISVEADAVGALAVKLDRFILLNYEARGTTRNTATLAFFLS